LLFSWRLGGFARNFFFPMRVDHKLSPYAVVFAESGYNRYSLAVLTGVLETDERFTDLDLYFVKTPHLADHVVTLAKRYQKLVVAFSFHTANIIEIGKTIGGLRDRLEQNAIENVLFIAGGPHPSGDPVGTLRLGFDVVVIGEGEVTFPNLLERYFTEKPYADIKGLGFLDADGQYHFTGHPELIDFSDFPPFAFKHRRFCPIEISRGCPWGCQFCQTSFFMGGRMRHRSLDSMMKYTELMKSLGLRVMRFISPASFAYGSPNGRTVNLDALETMLKAISTLYKKQQIFLGSFPSEVRPEQVSPEALGLIRTYCANRKIFIGAQSGSEALLEALHRGHGVAEVIHSVELTFAAGLTAHVDFIFGLPGETSKDREATLALMQRLTRMGARIHSHAFMPLVGTPLAQSQPGMVDPEIRQFLFRLQGNRLGHGRWKQQERIAQATTAFLARQQ
jgi:B12-binding domain/radical SAM domain protein